MIVDQEQGGSQQRSVTRSDAAARVCVSAGALLPYWRLLTLSALYVTDDWVTSDIFNGELPGRVLVAQLLRDGQLPVWTSQLCSGLPLAGAPMDPIGLLAFAMLPTAAALDLYVIVLLLVAAHGAYWFARRLGSDRTGAVLAGVAFAGSGYIACQLKHLGIVSTVVWLPVGLALIDRLLTGAWPGDEGSSTTSRHALMACFGLVFANQVLSGFPQSAYICALAYGAFTAFRLVERWKARCRVPSPSVIGGLAVATFLGAAAGAVVLLPLSALGNVSSRAEPLGYEWATRIAYWPPNVLTFLSPYFFGDISNNTYSGPTVFWEDYGYVGVATVLLALYGAVRERRRRRPMLFIAAMTVVAYAFVLGRTTPVYYAAYHLIPGLSLFRFPTRFLVIVDLGLALLGAIGLTRLRSDVARFSTPGSPVPGLVAGALCALTATDLFVHQPRQNPMVSGARWLAAPDTVAAVHADGPASRTYTPDHHDLHYEAFRQARGWANVEPYFALRNVLQPNTGGGYWQTASVDCYSGLTPRWYGEIWDSMARRLTAIDFREMRLRVHPALPNVLRAFGATHVLSAYPEGGTTLGRARHEAGAFVYGVEGAARARFVRAARLVQTDKEAISRLLATDFDPRAEIVLHDAPATTHPQVAQPTDVSLDPSAGHAAVVREDSTQVVIEVDAPDDGFLLLADTYYPGWTADVDGVSAPIYRANVSVRGVPIAKGRHTVRFTFDLPGFVRGLSISVAALGALVLWLAAGCVRRQAR